MAPSTRSRLLAALERGRPAVALFDREERLRYANASFSLIFKVESTETLTWEELMRRCHRRHCGMRVPDGNMDRWLERVRRRFRRVPERSFSAELVDGRWLWISETLDDDGWLLQSCVDMTSVKATEASLRAAHDAAVIASLTDPLTELYNRRFILRRLDDQLQACRQMRVDLCVALIDLDHFKLINDVHGHGAGDRVLKRFARHLNGQVRPLDAVGRIGGEEFLFVMPNASIEGARAMLKRLRRHMGQEVSDGLAEPACTFSAGLTLALADDTADSLVSRADRALYAAKQKGRNRDVALRRESDPADFLSTEP